MIASDLELREAAAALVHEALPAVGNEFDGPGYAIEYYDPRTQIVGDYERGSLHVFERFSLDARPKPVALGPWIAGIAFNWNIPASDSEIGKFVDFVELERRGAHG